jgi:hypothetical protein
VSSEWQEPNLAVRVAATTFLAFDRIIVVFLTRDFFTKQFGAFVLKKEIVRTQRFARRL